MSRALIIVDVQNDFLPGGALAVADGDAILAFVLRLMREQGRYELIVATQDWHPQGHGSFSSSHPGRQPFELGELDGLAQMLWPDHCIAGSEGARLAEEIRQTLVDITRQGQRSLIIQKGQDPRVDSYSAFFDNARRHDTGLHRALQAYGITEVEVVGLAFDYCVKFTALDSASLGYQTSILLEGTRAVDPASAAQINAELKAAGVVCR
jgi:nicotinamidase/pyrazinamidase